jgi:hypothetical protein
LREKRGWAASGIAASTGVIQEEKKSSDGEMAEQKMYKKKGEDLNGVSRTKEEDMARRVELEGGGKGQVAIDVQISI